jgi:uncharacterized membrane protein YtjA (UPF0391 family)
MLYYALIFFVISVVAGFMGFKKIESGASKIAKLFFYIFLILAILFFATSLLGLSLIA